MIVLLFMGVVGCGSVTLMLTRLHFSINVVLEKRKPAQHCPPVRLRVHQMIEKQFAYARRGSTGFTICAHCLPDILSS